jgi:8-oxo-dGTP pyrophosphatase MutT (NUDIX family)
MSPYLRRLRELVGNELLVLPSVAVIPRDDEGRVLLVLHADNGQWGTIGGMIEPDERPRDAGRREALEEAAVTVELTRLVTALGGPEFRARYANGDETAYVSIVYEAAVVDGEPTPDGDETLDVRWFASDELAGADLSSFARASLTELGIM